MTILHPERISVGREEAARTCEAAALEIDMRGWTQGATQRDDGSVCMIGALRHALGWNDFESGNKGRYLLTGNGLSCIPVNFNDAPGRTADEVKFVLRLRAAEIRSGR